MYFKSYSYCINPITAIQYLVHRMSASIRRNTFFGRLVNRIYLGVMWGVLYLFECAGEKVYERQPEDYSQHPTLSQ